MAGSFGCLFFFTYFQTSSHKLYTTIPRSIHTMKNKNIETLIISILIPLAVGAVSSLLSGTMMNTNFNQPSFAPPPSVFPIVWTILYILMGISSYLVYTSDSPFKTPALLVYAIQLVFNFFWSILFFRFSLYGIAFLWLLALIGLIVIMIYLFFKAKPLAAYLQIPYLLWCLFAAYLNYVIYTMN